MQIYLYYLSLCGRRGGRASFVHNCEGNTRPKENAVKITSGPPKPAGGSNSYVGVKQIADSLAKQRFPGSLRPYRRTDIQTSAMGSVASTYSER
jgi:hypothetical protein